MITDGYDSASFTITQEAAATGEGWVHASATSYFEYASPKAQTIEVWGGGLWYVESKPDWISSLNPHPTAAVPSSAAFANMTVITTQNNTGANRSGAIVFRVVGSSTTSECIVTQGTN